MKSRIDVNIGNIKKMKEKRTMKRFDLELPILVKGKNMSGKNFQEETTSMNISSAGTFFALATFVDEKFHLKMTRTLPNKIKNQVHQKGMVVRSKRIEENYEVKTEMGVRFEYSGALRF